MLLNALPVFKLHAMLYVLPVLQRCLPCSSHVCHDTRMACSSARCGCIHYVLLLSASFFLSFWFLSLISLFPLRRVVEVRVVFFQLALVATDCILHVMQNLPQASPCHTLCMYIVCDKALYCIRFTIHRYTV